MLASMLFSLSLLAITTICSVLDWPSANTSAKRIDWQKIESQLPPPNNIFIDKFYPVSQYNLLGNQSWGLAPHPTTNDLVWIHRSQWKLLREPKKLEVIKAESTAPSRRGQANYIGFRGTGNPNCIPPSAQRMGNCLAWTYFSTVGHREMYQHLSVVPVGENSNPHYTPTLNVYADDNCQQFRTSIIAHNAACYNLQLLSALPFNQYDSGL